MTQTLTATFSLSSVSSISIAGTELNEAPAWFLINNTNIITSSVLLTKNFKEITFSSFHHSMGTNLCSWSGEKKGTRRKRLLFMNDLWQQLERKVWSTTWLHGCPSGLSGLFKSAMVLRVQIIHWITICLIHDLFF